MLEPFYGMDIMHSLAECLRQLLIFSVNHRVVQRTAVRSEMLTTVVPISRRPAKNVHPSHGA